MNPNVPEKPCIYKPILGVHLKCKEPRGSENVRADPGRGVTEDRSVIVTTGELASWPITEDRSVIATTGERRNDL